jgi:hypothetical protein
VPKVDRVPAGGWRRQIERTGVPVDVAPAMAGVRRCALLLMLGALVCLLVPGFRHRHATLADERATSAVFLQKSWPLCRALPLGQEAHTLVAEHILSGNCDRWCVNARDAQGNDFAYMMWDTGSGRLALVGAKGRHDGNGPRLSARQVAVAARRCLTAFGDSPIPGWRLARRPERLAEDIWDTEWECEGQRVALHMSDRSRQLVAAVFWTESDRSDARRGIRASRGR